MKLTVNRHESKDGATVGTLSVDGVPCCFTLEDVVREVQGEPVWKWKVPNFTAIPRGTYSVIVTHSEHFGKDMPLLLNVPGYEGVRIHPGNRADDTEGCVLVGYVEGDNTIGRSRDAFDHLFTIMDDALSHGEPVTITIA